MVKVLYLFGHRATVEMLATIVVLMVMHHIIMLYQLIQLIIWVKQHISVKLVHQQRLLFIRVVDIKLWEGKKICQ
jgi:hypothetical protein